MKAITLAVLSGMIMFLGSVSFADSVPVASVAGAVAKSAEEVKPLAKGAVIPAVILKTEKNQDFNLVGEVAKKPAVIIFYRGGWCPYCNSHLSQLQTIEKNLTDLGFQVLAISPDLPDKHKNILVEGSVAYTLLSDSSMKAAKAFGLAFKVDDETLKRYTRFGISLDVASGQSHHLLPVPAVYLVNKDGVVEFVHADPNYKNRLAPEAILEAATKVAKK